VREQREIRRAAADVDVGAVGLVPDRDDLRAERLERSRRESCVCAVRTVDDDPQSGEIGAEAVDHVLEVAVCCDADTVDRAAAASVGVEQRLDRLLLVVDELPSVAGEELDAVVLRRIVRSGDDDAEIEREQRDRGRREHAGKDGVSARRDHAVRERLLELGAGGARVAPDEDASTARPERRGLAEALDERRRQELADDPADTVRAEVAPRHGRAA
jgi:hypothetical protein